MYGWLYNFKQRFNIKQYTKHGKANSVSEEDTKPLIILICRKPRCFGKSFSPNSISYYYYNTKAWTTMTIWEEWLVKINNDFRRRSRKVLWLVDNAPGHNIKKETKAKLTNVHEHYFRHI